MPAVNRLRKVPRVTLGGIAWVVLLGFVGYRIAPQVEAAVGAGRPGEPAPAFELSALDGGAPVSLEAYRGQVVLVNFWATWCPPCRIEMPGFQRVYEDKRDRGFVVLGLSTDQAGKRVVRDFLADREITFPVAMASGRVVRDFGGVHALPTSFLIDREGRIRQQVKGIFAEPALRLAVNHLLDEPALPPDADGGGP